MTKPILYSITLALCSAACTAVTPDESIAEAQQLIEQGHLDSAQEICDRLLLRTDSAAVGARAYGELSVVYMHLAELASQDDNIAAAANSYRRAYNLNADSADSYFMSLVGDDATRYAMLATLVSSFGHSIASDTTGWEFPNDTDGEMSSQSPETETDNP